MRAPLKDIGATAALAPTTNNEVTITRITSSTSRADGRNTPGVDVPFGFDGAITGTIPAPAATLTLGFELVRNVAKQESPLAQLREQQQLHLDDRDDHVLRHRSDRQRDQVTGQMPIEFGNFGDQ